MEFQKPPKSSRGIPLAMMEPREGSETLKVSHNWCDPTTWFTESERATGEELTTEDDLVFTSAHANWIDLNHGKYYNEDMIKAPYLPKVYVDEIEATERTPFADSGGNYVADYAAGTVTFTESQAGNTITADYSYEHGSLFITAPTSGKILVIEESEVQFAKDVILNDTVFFQAWAYNPEDLPNKMPAGNADAFKTIMNFIDEARGVHPEIPAIGGAKRGLSQPHMVFPFKYQVIRQLYASMGVEVRLWLENDIPFGGTYATVTFYCTSESEILE